MKSFINILGWVGAFLIILAYILVSFNYALSSSIVFQLLNLIGALFIVFSSYIKKDYQPVILNIFWMLVSLIAIISILG